MHHTSNYSRAHDLRGATVPWRLLVVDDHELVREGLLSLLRNAPGLEVVGEASSGSDAVALCRRLRPDLVLMDVSMPGMDGLEATRQIKERQPEVLVLFVTMHVEAEYAIKAIRAGAAGYVLKGASRRELLASIRQVQRGELMVALEVSQRLVQQLAHQTIGPSAPVIEPLTAREHEVLRLVAAGHTNREIATSLIVGTGTIKGYVENILRKLQVSDRTQAAVRAMQLGLVSPETAA